jgi:signal recognition particle subunit SRP68
MRYRRYCTRKINKLRKTLDYKYGSRTKFIKKDITHDKSEDKRILQIAMFSCEKYWAYAN